MPSIKLPPSEAIDDLYSLQELHILNSSLRQRHLYIRLNAGAVNAPAGRGVVPCHELQPSTFQSAYCVRRQ